MSCHSQKVITDGVSKPNTSKLDQKDMQLLFSDSYGGSAKKELKLIYNTKELETLYAKINRTKKPGTPAPNVDFSSHMIVYYAFGEQKGNELPTLDIVEESNEGIVLKPSPKKHLLGHTNITAPFCIYSIPFTTKKITIKD